MCALVYGFGIGLDWPRGDRRSKAPLGLSWARQSAEVLVWDLSYFERHIAGNLELQLERHGSSSGKRLRDWAAEVLARPWPRFAPQQR